MRGHRVNIVTLGCSKNSVDSQKLMRQLTAGGYSVTADGSDPADIVIINTCGFISDAREESIETILGHAATISREGRGRLIVMGCMVEKYRDELSALMPEVNAWFGVNRPQEITSHLGLVYNDQLAGERILSGATHYAYLKVSEGCDRGCTFCAIPEIRGRYISTPQEALEEEARILVSRGVRELILIAQDLTLYGYDLYGHTALPGLVERLSGIKELRWIRLHYLHPSGFPMEILEMMQDNNKICKYIDLPIQHISDKMLRMMHREHDALSTRRLLNEIRGMVPDAAVRTTVITGHPGETESEFRELKEFISEYRFERLGAFRYSREEGTYSAQHYHETVPERVREERVAEIMSLQQEISAENNSRLIGRVLRMVADRREGAYLIGRTEHDSPDIDQEVLVRGAGDVKPGTFMDVKITGSTEFDLFGEVAEVIG